MAIAGVRRRPGYAGTNDIRRSCKSSSDRDQESVDNTEPQIDFQLDITGARASRVEIDWNSKKAGKYKKLGTRNAC